MYKLFVSKKVDKFIDSLENSKEVWVKIRLLKNFKSDKKLELDIKKLKGQKKNLDLFRLRIGTIRIIFQVLDNKKVIWVKAADFRGECLSIKEKTTITPFSRFISK